MKRKGFTLIELLSVIIVLGVVIGVAIPGINMVIVNGRKNTFVKDAQIMNTNINQKLSANLIKRPKENGVTIVSIDQIQTDNNRESAFRAEWDYTRSYFIIHNHKKNNKTVYDHYVALLDEKGNGVELIKVNNLEKKHVIKEPTIVQIGKGFLEGSTKGTQSYIPKNLFSKIKNTEQAVVYSSNSQDEKKYGNNIIPPNQRTMENWNKYYGAEVITKRAPFVGRNLLLNSINPKTVILNSNDGSRYPKAKEYLMENGVEFQRIKRIETHLQPSTFSVYTGINLSTLVDDVEGKEITVSFTARASIETTGVIALHMIVNGVSQTTTVSNTPINLSTEWQRYSITFTIPVGTTVIRVNPNNLNMKGTINNFYLDIMRYSIEYSNNALKDWQPAWEELPLSDKPATYIKTIGGTSTLKYYVGPSGISQGEQYRKSIVVKNLKEKDMTITFNDSIPAQIIKQGDYVYVDKLNNVKTSTSAQNNQLRFQAIDLDGDNEMEFIAYNPSIRKVLN